MNIVDGTKISPVHFTGYQEVQSGGEVIVCEVPYVGGIADSRLTERLRSITWHKRIAIEQDILYLEITLYWKYHHWDNGNDIHHKFKLTEKGKSYESSNQTHTNHNGHTKCFAYYEFKGFSVLR